MDVRIEDEAATAVKEEIPAELVITLRKPVNLGELVVTELRLREPTGGEMERWDGMQGNAADNMAISVVSGVPLSLVKQIGSRDLREAAHYLARFL